MSEIFLIFLKATAFFIGAFLVGKYLLQSIIKLSDKNTSTGAWSVFALVFALIFAQVSQLAGLAPIIGSFVAGLIVEEAHFKSSSKMNLQTLQGLLKPLTDVLLPVFFVSIGAKVRFDGMGTLSTMGFMIALLVVALIGKVAAGWIVKGSGFDRWGIGIGMIPRGEVGLIFASYGLNHHILSTSTYSVLILVVLLTTIMAPVLLKPRLKYF
jgi:Kef-type K+ transport system membrane component KefB